MKYVNYHCHSEYSNIVLADSAETPKGYVERIQQLGHTVYVSTEHNSSPNWVDKYLLCREHNLKFVYGIEGYIEYEGNSYHIMLMAKSEKGMYNINRLYYKQQQVIQQDIKNDIVKSGRRVRLTLDIIKSCDLTDIIVTNACLGGLFKECTGNLIEEIRLLFGNNLWIEVHPHISEKQIEMNKRAKLYAEHYKLLLVGANDSHYALEIKKGLREEMVAAQRNKSNNISDYDDEDDFYMDYPSYETMFNRFKEQGIWTEEEVHTIISNTNKIEEFEDIVIEGIGDLKVPTIYPNLSRKDRCLKLISEVNSAWYKLSKTIPEDRHSLYIDNIERELKEIFVCKMEDYFLTSKAIIEKGIEKGGVLTKSARGSAASFVTNMLLGFTTINRLEAKVPIILERFMTGERILATNEAADID